MAPRPKATIETAVSGRKPDLNPNTTQREISDRAELMVVLRQQQRTHFSRQSAAFASTGEIAYY
jgi:hypothetical protein